MLIILGVTIAIQWRRVQQAKYDAELKLRMIERGFTAEEIKTVISTSTGRSPGAAPAASESVASVCKPCMNRGAGHRQNTQATRPAAVETALAGQLGWSQSQRAGLTKLVRPLVECEPTELWRGVLGIELRHLEQIDALLADPETKLDGPCFLWKLPRTETGCARSVPEVPLGRCAAQRVIYFSAIQAMYSWQTSSPARPAARRAASMLRNSCVSSGRRTGSIAS